MYCRVGQWVGLVIKAIARRTEGPGPITNMVTMCEARTKTTIVFFNLVHGDIL